MNNESWGRYPKSSPEGVLRPKWLSDLPQFRPEQSYLPYAQGRSYGDSCLNNGGQLISTTALNRLISFNHETGILRAESGVTLAEILEVIVPHGWFLPVSPGTKFVSLGGALANDIHGKNHHRAGTFGNHVLRFSLLRSDGLTLHCSPDENSDFYRATIAGLGLTGLILWVEIQLKKIDGPFIDLETVPFDSLNSFFEISKDSDESFEYTVAWIDCVTRGENFGRGIFMRGNHSAQIGQVSRPAFWKKALRVPFFFPEFTLNRFSMKAFNTVYYNVGKMKAGKSVVPYDPFFYPLDSIHDWNRIYGRRGFVQFQCVVPTDDDNRAIKEVLQKAVQYGSASFLAVIKEFGEGISPGMLSFPTRGITLCMDFPYRGKGTDRLMSDLEHVVAQCGGRLYPAKDACMSPEHFKQFYPHWQQFAEYIDPQYCSTFWKRVTQESCQ